MNEPIERRPARPGEICSCGRPATVVFITAEYGDVPFCGTPAPARPAALIEDYRLTLARQALAEYHVDNTGLDAERLAQWCGRFTAVVENLISLVEQLGARP